MTKTRWTKGELFERLKDLPDNTLLYFNITEADGETNWDTTLLKVYTDTSICPGYEGCKHTEPEPFNEIILHLAPMHVDKEKWFTLADCNSDEVANVTISENPQVI